MHLGAYETPIEVIKEGAFERTQFRDIYSRVNKNWYKKSLKEFDQLKDLDQNYYCSSYYDVSINKYGIKCGTSLRFWEKKGWINKIDPYGWFHWYFTYWLGGKSSNDERQINRLEGIISRFKGKLVKMIKDADGKFDDYSISPKLRQILLHLGYELTEKKFY